MEQRTKERPANPYAEARYRTLERFAGRIAGPAECLFAAAFAQPLGDAARDALEKTAAALGYAQGATFVDVGQVAGGGAGGDAHDGGAGSLALPDAPAPLPPDELFELVEGLDPRCLVVADAEAARLLEAAWHEPVPQEATCRVFGRETRAFASLNALMGTPAGKQRAWAALKTLPKLA